MLSVPGNHIAIVGVLIAALIMVDVLFLGWVFVDTSVMEFIEEIGNTPILPNSLLL